MKLHSILAAVWPLFILGVAGAPGQQNYYRITNFRRDKFDAFGWTLDEDATSNNLNGSGPSYSPISGKFNPTPEYRAVSDFDFNSLQVGVHQEYIELDLFNYGLVKFSEREFLDYGLSKDDIHLIRYFAQQEIGHAELISNMLGPEAAKSCSYKYNINTIGEFFDLCQRVTRYGESGVYGFLPLLENGAVAQMLLQSITTEARQQFAFRQFLGMFPVPVWFEAGATQAMQWTLLSQHIESCPPSNFRRPVVFPIFPRLNVTNNRNPIDDDHGPAISTNRTALTSPDRRVKMHWQELGVPAGPYNQVTSSNATGPPLWAAWLNQLNLTYTPLENVDVEERYAETLQPAGVVFNTTGPSIVNGTMFLMITDANPQLTPANLSLINEHIVAGPALYVAG